VRIRRSVRISVGLSQKKEKEDMRMKIGYQQANVIASLGRNATRKTLSTLKSISIHPTTKVLVGTIRFLLITELNGGSK